MTTRDRFQLPAAAVAALAVLAAALPASANAARANSSGPPTITACVKTKTGAVKLLTTAKAKKKKCPKGSKKVTWYTQGTAGSNGASGVNGTNGTNGSNGVNGTNGIDGFAPRILDADGNPLGTLIGPQVLGPITLYSVLVGGGIYTYTPEGKLFPTLPAGLTPPVFTDSACTGPASLALNADASAVSVLGAQFRWVERATSATSYGPARAFAFSSTPATPVPDPRPTYYQLHATTGDCVVSTTIVAGQYLFPLTNVPAPRDVPGPLVFSA